MYIESGLDIGPGMEISLPPYPTTVEYLLVAGGGGGGAIGAGGGGGVVSGNYNIPAEATITTTIGAGGASLGSYPGVTGSNSSFVNDLDLTKSGSIYLNGSNQYLTNPDYASFDLGTDDFTVEGWYNFSSFASPTTMIALGNGAAYESISMAWSIIYSAGNLMFYRYNGANATTAGGTFTPPVSLRTGAWYHIACTRNGSDLKMFLNGFQIGTTVTTTSSYSPFNTNPLYIGSFQNNSILSNFNVSNVRVVKGVAVYTTNFTPSRTPLTSTQAANVNGYPSAAITGTQTLLLLNTVYGADYLKDSSSYNHTITNVNSATSQTLEPIYTVTSYGGGGGGSWSAGSGNDGKYGGSGGGAGGYPSAGSIGAGFQGQGYAGGSFGVGSSYGGGGGGGAGGVGANYTGITGGAGGAGVINAITGTSYYWAGGGGGGGGNYSAAGGSGGFGGGQGGVGLSGFGTMGTGYNNATTGGAGTNTGGGGGGSDPYNPQNIGTGGSGIAVYRYPAIFNEAAFTGNVVYTDANGYKTYIFTSSGTLSLAYNPPTAVDYLIVAGGGGGGPGGTGAYDGGGGGAGGLLTNIGYSVTSGTPYTVTVGAGGSSGTNGGGSWSNGSNSVFASLTAIGGGKGGAGSYPANGFVGGSGGGGTGGGYGGSGGTGTDGQGNNGASGYAGPPGYQGGGGGGAGAAGNSGGLGTGGDGISSSYSGASNYYGGGGGGGSGAGSAPAGGSGGGGAGGYATVSIGQNGTTNTGGGGGGGTGSGDATSGAGGSGIVIVRYPTSYSPAAATTGSPTYTVAGGYRIYKWITSGSITF